MKSFKLQSTSTMLEFQSSLPKMTVQKPPLAIGQNTKLSEQLLSNLLIGLAQVMPELELSQEQFQEILKCLKWKAGQSIRVSSMKREIWHTTQDLAIYGTSSTTDMSSSLHQAVFIGYTESQTFQFQAIPNSLADQEPMTQLKS